MSIILLSVGMDTEHLSEIILFEYFFSNTIKIMAVATLLGDLLIKSTHSSKAVHNLLHASLSSRETSNEFNKRCMTLYGFVT